jgi:hypothetical protein
MSGKKWGRGFGAAQNGEKITTPNKRTAGAAGVSAKTAHCFFL